MSKKLWSSLALLSALTTTPAYSLEVPNGDFEEGFLEWHNALWAKNFRAAELVEEKSAGDGRRCLMMTGKKGFSTNVYLNEKIKFKQVTRKYKVSFMLFREELPAGMKNAGSVSVQSTFYPAKGKNHSVVKSVNIAGIPAKKWTAYSMDIELPAGTEYNKFGMLLYNRGVPDGVTVYIDDVTVAPITK